VIEPEALGYTATFTSESGEKISFTMDPAFAPESPQYSYIGVGVTSASTSDAGRKLAIDDVSVTFSP
jgi:hypothetical protein